MVVALQTIVSRRLSPFENGVVTIGSFAGEGSFNVIKDSVELIGDIRAMSNETRAKIGEELRTISEGIAKAFAMKI